MREVLGAVIGVPATVLIAGGLGIIGVTLYSRVRRRREPIRWVHLGIGVVLFAAGAGLMSVEVLVVGA
jgi:hypothetical protein